jgi:hypothetical protein
VVEQNKGSFFKRKRLQNHRRSKSLGKVRTLFEQPVVFSLIFLYGHPPPPPCSLHSHFLESL